MNIHLKALTIGIIIISTIYLIALMPPKIFCFNTWNYVIYWYMLCIGKLIPTIIGRIEMKSLQELKNNIKIAKIEVENRRFKLELDRQLLQIAIDDFNREKNILHIAKLMRGVK